MRRIFYLTCALVVYGSLYPFHFVLRESPAGALEALRQSLDFAVNRGFLRDVLVNLLVYIPVGFFFVLEERPDRPAWLRALRAALAGAALSLCMELVQYYFPPREPSLIDWASNTLSAAAGGVLGIAFATPARHGIDTLAGWGLARPSSALFLVLVWIGALFSPGDWGSSQTLVKLRAFFAAGAPAPGLVVVASLQWIGIGALAAAVAGRRRTPIVLPVLVLALPLRFLVPGQRLQPYELAGAGIALCCWLVAPISRRLSPGVVAILVAVGVLVDGLRPWHFVSQSSAFGWIPFAALLDIQWPVALLILFRKCAIYGTAVWAIARCGVGIPGSTVLVSFLLASIEAVQQFLPGRTAETTDPVLAIVLGLVLLRLDHKYGRDPGVGQPLLERHAGAPPQPATGSARDAHTTLRGRESASGKKVWTGGRRSDL